eukprot:m.234838 g.234838  ORF g.234838 m.234838 type:complete len:422 (-) comp17392_c0_seq4:2410-3675(-)
MTDDKIEIQLYILQGSNNHQFIVDKGVINLSPTLSNLVLGQKKVFQNSLGGSTFSIEGPHAVLKREGRILATLLQQSSEHVVIALPEISSPTLELMIDFCNFILSEAGKDPAQCEAYDDKFLSTDTDQSVLCELASAAYYLDIQPLVTLTSRVLAAHISGKTPSELRAAFGLPPPQSTSPTPALGNMSARDRLHRKLAQRQSQPETPTESPDLPPASEPTGPQADSRSLEELLSFIGDNSDADKKKSKKRRNRRKGKGKPSDTEVVESHPESPHTVQESHTVQETGSPTPAIEEEPPSHLGTDRVSPEVAIALPTTPTSPYRRESPSGLAAMSQGSPSRVQLPPRMAPNPTLTAQLTQYAQPLQERRELARQKLAALDTSQVQWAEEDADDDEFDLEVEGFRRRLEADFGLFGSGGLALRS